MSPTDPARRAVAIFAEGDFEKVHALPTHAEAEAFAHGVVVGADMYGAGIIVAYTLPEDEDRMREEQGEAGAAWEAYLAAE